MGITDVVIIGGGVIGCSIAYQLRKRGAEVAVLDQGAIGAGASRAATGLLAPIRPFLRRDNSYMALQLAGLRQFPALVPELEAESGIAIEYQQIGTLRVVDLKQAGRLNKWIEDWRGAGYHVELLVGENLKQREPGLAPTVTAAIYNADEPQVNATKLVSAYHRAAANKGVTFLAQRQVSGLLRQGRKVVGVATAQGDIACGSLVIAAGAWSAFCCDWLGVALAVRPLRGQSLALQLATPLHHILFGEGIYMAPKMDGSVIVGATQEEAGFDATITPEGIASLMRAVEAVAPSLATSAVKSAWAGLRPRTPDRRPIIGLLPGWENVVIASGHGGFGMLLSSVTGQTVAEFIVTGQIPSVILPFAFERFSSQPDETANHHAA